MADPIRSWHCQNPALTELVKLWVGPDRPGRLVREGLQGLLQHRSPIFTAGGDNQGGEYKVLSNTPMNQQQCLVMSVCMALVRKGVVKTKISSYCAAI